MNTSVLEKEKLDKAYCQDKIKEEALKKIEKEIMEQANENFRNCHNKTNQNRKYWLSYFKIDHQ